MSKLKGFRGNDCESCVYGGSDVDDSDDQDLSEHNLSEDGASGNDEATADDVLEEENVRGRLQVPHNFLRELGALYGGFVPLRRLHLEAVLYKKCIALPSFH